MAVSLSVCVFLCLYILMSMYVCIERRGRGGKPSEGDVRHNLIYSPSTDDQPDDDMRSHRRSHGDKAAAGSRPMPKPRSASTSSTLDPTADLVKESSEPVRPRPRARGSQESLDRSFDQPPPQHRPRARGSQDSLDKSLDMPAPQHRPRTRASQESLDRSFDQPTPQHRPRARGSQDSLDKSLDQPAAKQRPTPATRRSQENLDTAGVDRPKPRARQGSLDRSLDESYEQKPARGPQGPQTTTTRGPQVAVKQTGKKPAKDRAAYSSDGTDV